MVDLMSDTSTGGWIEWQKYTTAEPMYKGEVGRAEGCKFVASTNAIDKPLNTGVACSASVITIMGQQALAAVDFQNTYDGKGQNYIIVKKTGSEDIGNPLNLIAGTVGFKATFAAVVLNTSCGIHLMGLRN
jgi:N4-gp56 family major capsid protein